MKNNKAYIILLMILLLTAGCANHEIIPAERLDAGEFMKVLQDTSVILIDVRTIEEHEDGCIPGTDYLIDVLEDDFSELCDKNLPDSSTVAIYCRSGNRSQKAARILSSKGHKVFELESGYNGWKESQKQLN